MDSGFIPAKRQTNEFKQSTAETAADRSCVLSCSSYGQQSIWEIRFYEVAPALHNVMTPNCIEMLSLCVCLSVLRASAGDATAGLKAMKVNLADDGTDVHLNFSKKNCCGVKWLCSHPMVSIKGKKRSILGLY